MIFLCQTLSTPVVLKARRLLSMAAESLPKMEVKRSHRVVCVEGNIGSGKSTLLKLISKTAPSGLVTLSHEPVRRWRNYPVPSDKAGSQSSVNLLAMLYESPDRWSFTFNLELLLARLKTHRRQPRRSATVRLMERSVFSTYHIFARNSRAIGDLTNAEALVLQAHFNLIAQPAHVARSLVDLFVYVRVPPETCQHRVLNRGRKEESAVSLDFLRQLHEHHETYFGSQSGETVDGVPVIIVENSMDDIPTLKNKCSDVIDQILYPEPTHSLRT